MRLISIKNVLTVRRTTQILKRLILNPWKGWFIYLTIYLSYIVVGRKSVQDKRRIIEFMQILLRNGNMKFKLCPPSSQLQTIFYSLNKLEKRGRDSRGWVGEGVVGCGRCKNQIFFIKNFWVHSKNTLFHSILYFESQR